MAWFGSRSFGRRSSGRRLMMSAIAPVLLWGAGMAIAPLPVASQGETQPLPDNWPVLVNQAIVQRDFARVLELQERALAATDPGDKGEITDLLDGISQAQLSLGRNQAALDTMQRYVEITGGQVSYNMLGRAGLGHFRLGRYDRAVELITTAIEGWEKLREGQEEDLDRITLLEQQSYLYRLLVKTLIAAGRTDEALVWAERSRARSLVELLVQQESGTAATVPPIPTLKDIKATARSQKATLVIYSVLSHRDKIYGDDLEDDRLLGIWAVSPKGKITFQKVDLRTWELESLLKLVQSTQSVVTSPFPIPNIPQLHTLHELLIDPIAAALPQDPNERVIFVLQGSLYLIPIAALQDEENRYLVERHTLGTAPSVQALALAKDLKKKRGNELKGGLVIGNPELMPLVPVGRDRSPERLSALPGAESEAEVIARLLNADLLLTDQATETRVRQTIERQPILHFATHGLLNLDANLNEFGLPLDPNARTAREGGVTVSPGGVVVGDGVFINGVPANIALAREGVARPAVPGILALASDARNDGLFKATEIAQLNLQAQMVVLSACDTGRGRVTGDGVVGLARAFMAAGIPTVVASLWKVPDDATRTLMVAFYRALLDGQDKAQALRTAMLATRQEFPGVRNWAAFTVLGTPD
ncbi:MAG: CHAT domain-containing tetratricopeptide repeat protein [Cyanobacteria bacterium P01_H01_bin.130]